MTWAKGQWRVICTSCNCEKLLEDFYIHSNGKPRKQCKTCLALRKAPQNSIYRNKIAEKYRERNTELCRDRNRTWRKNNLVYDAYRSSLYRATKLQRTVYWANINKIKEVYLNCPEGFHVDHIIPLRGKLVSGLHNEYNLQYLPAIDNIKKRNIYVV